MSADNTKLWFRLQGVLCGILFFLIVFGAGVRLANAGLACPDWPKCFGVLVPDFNFGIFMEWFHRLIAGSVGIIAFLVGVKVFRTSTLRTVLGMPVCISLFLFGVQAFLGGQTVLQFLRGEIVTAHLAFGYLLFATNLAIYIRWKKMRSHSEILKTPLGLKIFARVVFVVSYLQAILGALVSSHYAGLACPDFPTCHDHWIPSPFEGNIAIHMLHRMGAVAVLITSLIYLLYTLRISRRSPQLIGFHKLAKGGFIVVVVQWCLGISMIFSTIHPGLSLFHSLFALSIFSMYVIGAVRVGLSK